MQEQFLSHSTIYRDRSKASVLYTETDPMLKFSIQEPIESWAILYLGTYPKLQFSIQEKIKLGDSLFRNRYKATVLYSGTDQAGQFSIQEQI
jgi:hypothetical protein